VQERYEQIIAGEMGLDLIIFYRMRF